MDCGKPSSAECARAISRDGSSSLPLLLAATSQAELFEQGLIPAKDVHAEVAACVFSMQSVRSSSASSAEEFVHLYSVKAYELSRSFEHGLSKKLIEEFESYHRQKSIEHGRV